MSVLIFLHTVKRTHSVYKMPLSKKGIRSFTFIRIKVRSQGTGRKKLERLFVMFLYQFHSKKKAHNLCVWIMRFFLGVKLV